MFEAEEPSPGSPSTLGRNCDRSREDLKFYGTYEETPDPVVLVTNCSNGEIGHYIATQFARKRCHLICIAPRLDLLSDLRGDKFDKIAADLLLPKEMDRVLSYLQIKYSRIDIVMIPPSLDALGPVIELGREEPLDYRSHDTTDMAGMVYQANILTPLSFAQRIARLMMANHLKGTITFIGSVLGDVSTPWNALFSSSMAALHSLADSFRLEVAPFQIKVLLFKMGYDKSMVINNNLPNMKFSSDSLYKTVENHVAYRAVWNRHEIESRGKVFASVVVYTTLNRHRGAHGLLELAFAPYKTLVSLGGRLASWVIPELVPHLNYFSSTHNPNWPCSRWEYEVGGERLLGWALHRRPRHSIFLDWFRWDWLGLGHVGHTTTTPTTPRLLAPSPNLNLLGESESQYGTWSPSGRSEAVTLFQNEGPDL